MAQEFLWWHKNLSVQEGEHCLEGRKEKSVEQDWAGGREGVWQMFLP